MKIKNSLKKKAIKKAFKVLSKVSDENIVRLAYLIEQFTPRKNKGKVRFVRKLYQKKHPALALTKRIISEVDKNCQEKFLENLILTGFLENQKKRDKSRDEGSAPLFTLLISPSMRCNLRCKGCYAQNYKKEDDLPFELLDRIVKEAKEMGVAFFTILGGEPFIREDLFEIYKKHSDTYFQVYTNGTLIDERVAQKLVKLGNVIPQISIEGFEKETDDRRGKGTYKKIVKAMDILKKNHVPFGYSVCVTRKNAEIVTSDKFVDFMIEKGALVGWYFLYMPVSGDKNTELMPTPEQRNQQRLRRDYLRAKKPIFVIDFWNDAPYVGGCIAGKQYSHITNFGDVEPCIFTHFSQVNIKNNSLKKVMSCQFFKEIRKRQPFSPNLLTPCMLIDQPKVIRDLCQLCKPYPTHSGARTLTEDLKDDLDKYSREVHQIYDKIWEEENKPESKT
jgi:MoaA/NifB/PqqE/SkfB family radical SAM enzyme